MTAAEVLKDARLKAGLTQSDLSKKACITQSVISAYESGRRDPSLRTLNKLVSAAGFALAIGLTEKTLGTDKPRDVLSQKRGDLISAFEHLGATNIRVFGSVARGEAGPESDIDLLVDLAPGVGLFALAELHGVAERMLGMPVDVVPESGLKESTKSEILSQAIAL